MNSKIANDGYFNTVVATTGIFAKLVIDDIIVDEITIESLDVVGNATFGKNIIMAKTLGPQGLTGQGQLLQGTGTLLHTFGESNLFLGNGSGTAGNFATEGIGNIGIGTDALESITTGDFNLAIGATALNGITTGDANIGIGQEALKSLTSGSNNTSIGFGSGFFLTSGSNNLYITNGGEATESGIIRIGTPGTQTVSYLSAKTVIAHEQFGGDVGNGATITGVMIGSGIVTLSGLGAIIDTGANIETAIPSLPNANFGQVLKFLAYNTTAAACTITGGAGIVITGAGSFTVPLKDSRLIYLLRTGAGLFTAY